MKKKKRTWKKWTEEEEQRLANLSEDFTKKDIARLMKRSAASVNNKRQSMGLYGLLDTTDKWNFKQISDALGLSAGVVNRTFVKYGLKFKKRGQYCLVEEDDLLQFMQDHPELWNASKADYYLFSQFPWFLEKLKEDKKDNIKNNGYYWTDYQKQQFESLSRKGYTHKQIAEVIGKTKKAVDHYSAKIGKNNKRNIERKEEM